MAVADAYIRRRSPTATHACTHWALHLCPAPSCPVCSLCWWRSHPKYGQFVPHPLAHSSKVLAELPCLPLPSLPPVQVSEGVQGLARLYRLLRPLVQGFGSILYNPITATPCPLCSLCVQVGAGVQGLAPGDPVALEPGVPCWHCSAAREGRYNLDPGIQFFATPPGRPC